MASGWKIPAAHDPAWTAEQMVRTHGPTEARRRAVEQATSERMADREFWTAVVAKIDEVKS